MISVRKLMGINNESKAVKYNNGTEYYAFTTTGTNGEMLTVLGPAKSFSSSSLCLRYFG